jgi:hypothetical protein
MIRMLVKLNGKFFAKRCTPVVFRLAKKFDEINPRWQVKCEDKGADCQSDMYVALSIFTCISVFYQYIASV